MRGVEKGGIKKRARKEFWGGRKKGVKKSGGGGGGKWRYRGVVSTIVETEELQRK